MGWVGASRLIGLGSLAGLLRQILANSATGIARGLGGVAIPLGSAGVGARSRGVALLNPWLRAGMLSASSDGDVWLVDGLGGGFALDWA